MKIAKKLLASTVAGLSVAPLWVFTAPASFAENYVVEEIVVQARKRGENLQDAPMAVTAFNENAIEDAGIKGMRDYVALIPNVTLMETQNVGFAFINVRGLSQLRNTDPTVAMVLDGVLSTSPLSFSQELFDVEQIEFLKGPQGALYGRNSLGGAINIRTKQPSDQLEGMIRANMGNGEAYGVQGTISGPVMGHNLLGRLAVSFKDSDGTRDNVFLDQPADPYKDISARGKLLWFANDWATVDLRASVSRTEGAAQQFIVNAPQWMAGNAGSPLPPFLRASGGDTVYIFPPGSPLGNPVGDPNNTSVPIQGNILGLDERDVYSFSAKIDWEASFGVFTAISAYDEVEHGQGGEQLPYTSFSVEKATNFRDSSTVSQELRFTSPDEYMFRWITGAYFASTDFFLSNARILDTSGLNFESDDIVARFPFPNGRNNNGVDPTVLFQGDDNDNFAWALFAQASYDLTDRLELTVAARYDVDEREQTVQTPAAFSFDFVDLSFGDSRKEEFKSFQPKATLRWQPLDNITTYATYSQGFRSGGFNPSGVGVRAEALRQAGNLAVPAGINDVYDKEETENIEFGFKYQNDDRTVVLNSAVFFTQVSDQQLFNVVFDLNTAQIIRNIDKVEIRGAELDVSWVLTDNLTMTFGAGLIDSEITEFSANPAGEGGKAPLNPEYTVNVGLSYNRVIPVGAGSVDAYFRADYQRMGKTWWEPSNYAPRDEIDLLNLRAGFETVNGLNFAVWAKNVTDENYLSEIANPPGAAYYAPTRKYGIEITKHF